MTKPLTTGLTIHLYTSKDEIIRVQTGESTMLIATTRPDIDFDVQFTAAADACEFAATEVRVNIEKLAVTVEKIGTQMAAAMGAELEKVFANLGEMLK